MSQQIMVGSRLGCMVQENLLHHLIYFAVWNNINYSNLFLGITSKCQLSLKDPLQYYLMQDWEWQCSV